jgi:hypothetical protein
VHQPTTSGDCGATAPDLAEVRQRAFVILNPCQIATVEPMQILNRKIMLGLTDAPPAARSPSTDPRGLGSSIDMGRPLKKARREQYCTDNPGDRALNLDCREASPYALDVLRNIEKPPVSSPGVFLVTQGRGAALASSELDIVDEVELAPRELRRVPKGTDKETAQNSDSVAAPVAR